MEQDGYAEDARSQAHKVRELNAVEVAAAAVPQRDDPSPELPHYYRWFSWLRQRLERDLGVLNQEACVSSFVFDVTLR
jgi:hypothetical protein